MNQSITQHLEGFLSTARKLEEALGEEKKRSQKIAQEYLATRTTLENAVRELQNRLIQRENKLQTTTESYANLQSIEARLRNELREVAEREQKNRAELAQYQAAWNEVLAREAQARTAVLEYEKAKATLNEQRTHIKSLETRILEVNQNAANHSRHAETYQRELQSALIRIQSAEAKYSQIQKELSVLSQSKRSADEEIARIELSMKERFRWELATEKERLRAELEKDSALDRERFREVSRNQMRTEIDRQLAEERRMREAAETELERRTSEMERLRARLHALGEENEAMKNEINSATSRADQTERENTSVRNELAIQRLDGATAQSKYEALKKEMNRALLVERLRQEDEVREYRRQINELIETGVTVAKIESLPDGVTVYSATPVGHTESRASANPARQNEFVDQTTN